jgi:hypothetical protein
MPFTAAGGEYKFYGRFVTHAKHGRQFEIAKYELLPPDNEQKIRVGLTVLAECPEKLAARIGWFSTSPDSQNAQGIEAEIPQTPRRGGEELERIARSPAKPGMRPNSQSKTFTP